MNVLIIEDNGDSGRMLSRILEAEGYDITLVDDPEVAVETAKSLNPCAVVFDTMAAHASGFECCRALRRHGRTEPILFLSAQHEAVDRASGLIAGADDYIGKPYELEELLVRLRAHLMRRAVSADATDRRIVGRLVLDMGVRQAYFGNVHIRLTQREAELLAVLMQNANHPVCRGDIYDELWGVQGGVSLNVVDVYVGYLRTKFAEITRVGGPFIGTVRGRGFMLDMAGYKCAAR